MWAVATVGPDGNPLPSADTPETSQTSSASVVVRTIHYLVIGLLLGGGFMYWALKPASLNPMADARAAEAMALVQTHRAQRAPTLRQAITDRVQVMKARGQGVRTGEWRVVQEQGDRYLVSITVREQGTKQWFEREYLWRVDLANRSVDAMTLPAADLMPLELESRPPIPARSQPQH